jgi:cytochrome P450
MRPTFAFNCTPPLRPERWENIPETAKAIPGVYSNLLAFIAGTHACIGYRFSVIE